MVVGQVGCSGDAQASADANKNVPIKKGKEGKPNKVNGAIAVIQPQ